MAANTTSQDKSTLSGYLWNQLDEFAQNRQPLEDKWNANFSVIKSEIEDKADRLKEGEGEGWRSTRFLNKTKQKVSFIYALFIDMLLQGGKIPYMLKPSPVDEEVASKQPELKQKLDEAIDNMTDLLDQQLVDCDADRHMMRIGMSGALYGEYWSKNSVIDVTRKGYRQEVPPGIPPEMANDPTLISWTAFSETHKSPVPWLYRPVWQMYWDVEEPDLQKGAGIYEEVPVSAHWLRGQKGKMLFIDKNLDSVLSEIDANSTTSNTIGKNTIELLPRYRNLKFRNKTILFAEYWGRVPRKVAEDFEAELIALHGEEVNPESGEVYQVPNLNENVGEGNDKPGDEVEIVAAVCSTGANKTPMVVRYGRIPEGKRPYQRGFWEEDLDGLGGISVADNTVQAQAAINGFVRALEDNVKLAGNVMLAWKRRFIINADDIEKNGLKPGMIFDISEDCTDARAAIQQIQLADMSTGIAACLGKWEEWFDEESLVPKIAQGMITPGDRTAYELSTMMEKAGKYVGSAIRNMDESTIEPGMQFMYQYNMDDPDVQAGKGSYVVKALGFTSFQDRVIRVSKIMQFISLLMSNPMLGSYAKWPWLITEIAKALDMDPDQSLKSEQERNQEAQAMAEAQAQAEAAKAQQTQPAAAGSPADSMTQAAGLAKTQADIEAKRVDSAVKVQKMKLDRAKLISEIERRGPGQQVAPKPEPVMQR
jgi:hypothetical protein